MPTIADSVGTVLSTREMNRSSSSSLRLESCVLLSSSCWICVATNEASLEKSPVLRPPSTSQFIMLVSTMYFMSATIVTDMGQQKVKAND